MKLQTSVSFYVVNDLRENRKSLKFSMDFTSLSFLLSHHYVLKISDFGVLSSFELVGIIVSLLVRLNATVASFASTIH